VDGHEGRGLEEDGCTFANGARCGIDELKRLGSLGCVSEGLVCRLVVGELVKESEVGSYEIACGWEVAATQVFVECLRRWVELHGKNEGLVQGSICLSAMCKCGGRRSVLAGFVSEVHGCDEAVPRGEDVENLAVGKDIALKVLDDLMDVDADLVCFFGGDGEWFDVGIELTPLARPVRADFFFADNLASLRSLRPGHVFGHEG